MKILIADDSKTNLAFTTHALTTLGHTVLPVTSGAEALQSFQKNAPDLVILDVVMEGMDGFETATKIRAINTENWIPIIFLSANVDDESLKKGIDAGGDDYITKPFSEITLAAKIKAMQRIADMRQKLIATSSQLERLSSTDTLTGLYNRFQFDRTLTERLSGAERHRRLMGLMFIDLDNFKLINDTFGHPVGDLLLKDVAKRLKNCLRTEDFIARIGGDEFTVIFNDIESIESIGLVAQKMLDILSVDFYIEKHNIRIGASIGLACYPLQGTTKENLLKHADIAMYHAKSMGRNNYQYFNEELNERYKQHINIEYALKFALDRREIFLHYQPIYDITTRQVAGLEALVCWEHPKFGNVSPGIFIPIAEETGMITMIGNWILRNACEQARKWNLDKHKNFKLSVNLSSHQLLQEDFFEMVVDILNHTNLPPQFLELELTETTIMSHRTDLFKNLIQKLHDFGISIAIDDFGTGYSSLTRLKHLSIDTLKIDHNFVQDVTTDPNSAIIVNCLIALGKNLDLKVIAEGIETDAQLQFLKSKGCLYGQGYLLGRPVNADNMEKILKNMVTTGG
ncbi:MAG TPA: EAL domain-containing protein [Gammaproteobacteria bacterium]|nr:EAL domain-containing protein [Gammaproteobacteria bacterium]